jgi:hypothetical protein
LQPSNNIRCICRLAIDFNISPKSLKVNSAASELFGGSGSKLEVAGVVILLVALD